MSFLQKHIAASRRHPEPKENIGYKVRKMTAQPGEREYSFVRETTIKVRRPKGIGFRRWERAIGPEIDALIACDNCYVAEFEDDEGGKILLGFLLLDHAHNVHMLYVKRDFRGHEIGHQLIRAVFGSWDITVVKPMGFWREFALRNRIVWVEAH